MLSKLIQKPCLVKCFKMQDNFSYLMKTNPLPEYGRDSHL